LSTLSDLLEEVCCPICGGSEYDVIKKSNYPDDLPRDEIVEIFRSSSDTELMDQMVACKSCGLVYLNPRFNEKIILESYSEGTDTRFASQNHLRIRTFRRVFDRWAKRFGVSSGDSSPVLDVGCAAGAFPKAADELGFPVVGVEPSAHLSGYAREEFGLDVRTGVLEDQHFPDASFQVITLWDVIEHLSNPVQSLQEIHRILKPGGHLVVNYPDYDSWPCKIMGSRWPFFLSVHLTYFTPKSIDALLAKAGFQILRLERHYQTLELGYLFERASQYVPFFRHLGKLTGFLGMNRLPMTYYMGQTLVTATKS